MLSTPMVGDENLNQKMDTDLSDSSKNGSTLVTINRSWKNYLSVISGSLTLLTMILGTGMLALPNAIAEVGWIAAILTIIFSMICHITSFYFFSKVQVIYPQSRSFSDIVKFTLGKVRID